MFHVFFLFYVILSMTFYLFSFFILVSRWRAAWRAARPAWIARRPGTTTRHAACKFGGQYSRQPSRAFDVFSRQQRGRGSGCCYEFGRLCHAITTRKVRHDKCNFLFCLFIFFIIFLKSFAFMIAKIFIYLLFV